MSKPTTRDNLNDIMSMDHVIEVHADGTVTDAGDNVRAPEVWIYSETSPNDAPEISGQAGRAWQLMTGYSNQDRYAGPVMHASEYIGGGLADVILAAPGLYAVVEVRDMDADRDAGEDDSAGWAIAHIPADRPEVPADFPVKVLSAGEPATDRVTCGECGRSWDDAIATEWTPAPSARCPFEYFH